MLEKFENKIKWTIEKYNMLDSGEQVIAALSGGADSVCLVLVLKKLGYKVCAVHVNHMLRGEESDRDEDFCRDLCRTQGIELFRERVNVREYMKDTGLSLETAARELRYNAFKQAANYFGNEKLKVATAHNADDCLETAVFNLTRGSGIKGLCGVPPVRENFIRPLVNTSRAEIEEYLNEKSQRFVTDSTNFEADCSRNIIRLNVIPQLKKINGGILKSYMRSREIFSEDDDFLMREATKVFENSKTNGGFETAKFIYLHNSIKNRVLGEILRTVNVGISAEKISELDEVCKRQGKINLKKDLFAVCRDGLLKFETAPKEHICYETEIEINRKYDFFGRKVTLVEIDPEEAKVYKKFTKDIMDYDKIKGIIVLRNRRQGDRISLAGRGFTSSVKKLFNANVDALLRESRVILENQGELIFLEGFGVSERVKIDENTSRALRIVII